MLGTRRPTTMSIRGPVITRNSGRLELEGPRVVLVMKILVGDQLDVATWLGAHEGRSRLLPDQRPVIRIANPERCGFRLVTKLGMPLQPLMTPDIVTRCGHTRSPRPSRRR